MSSPSIEFHKQWVEQCEVAEGIRDRFGLQDALDYLVGEKLITFLMISERDSQFATEVPAFAAEIRRLFSARDLREYVNHLEQAIYLAPLESEMEIEDLEEAGEEDAVPSNPVAGAEELLRFCRVRELLLH